MQGDRGFTSAWFTFEQKHMATGQSAGQDVIQTFDAGGGFCTEQLVRCRQKMPSQDQGKRGSRPEAPEWTA
jgi:hypothetical protein